MPGGVCGNGRLRCHWNHPLIDPNDFQVALINAPLTALSTQWLFRKLASPDAPPWVFWGEQLLNRKGWKRATQKLLASPLSRASSIVAIGQRAAEDYRRRFPNVPINNIPYTCDLTQFATGSERREKTASLRFLYAGQMIHRKGVDVLLAAFGKLVREGSDAELHLVGRKGELESWLTDISPEARLRIVYHGFLQPPDLPAIFKASDVFVLPSRHDGWGVVVNQALGTGLPVITTDAAGAGLDLVDDGWSGFKVPSGDANALSYAMAKLVSDRDLHARMSMNATAKATELSPVSTVEDWMKILRDLAPALTIV